MADTPQHPSPPGTPFPANGRGGVFRPQAAPVDRGERFGTPSPEASQAFQRAVAGAEERRRQARAEPPSLLWRGFATFGRVGWSVAAPALLGVLIGYRLDARFPSEYSWTITLLLTGLMAGCYSAWTWVNEEHAGIRPDRKEPPSPPSSPRSRGEEEGPSHE